MIESDIPGWSFLALRFLAFFDDRKNLPAFAEVHRAYLGETPGLTNFPGVTPASLLMACYGRLVYPVEFWRLHEGDDQLFQDLDNHVVRTARHLGDPIASVKDLFPGNPGPDDTQTLLRRLRNAVSHARVDVKWESPVFELTFKDGRRRDSVDFCVTTTAKRLIIFLTGLGQFFGSHRETIQ